MSPPKPLPALTGSVGLATFGLGVFGALALDDPRLRFLAYLALSAAAAGGWLLTCAAARARPTPNLLRAAIAAGLLARLFCVMTAPAFSEDVFRYVYEGRLVWAHGPGFPFAHPPSAGPMLGVDPALLDAAWLRINHAEISTIYPPLAQAVFAGAAGLGELAGGGHLLFLKLALVAADLGVWFLVARRAGPAAGLVWGLCPIVIFEIAREGHADSLAALGLAVFVASFAHRPRLGYAGLGIAALAKLNGLIALPVALRATRRGAWIALGLAGLLAIPWLLAGPSAAVGLGEYASRWRAGDGAFSVFLAASSSILGGSWGRVGELTVTAHQLARGFTVLALGIATLILLRRPLAPDAAPPRAGRLILLVLLLGPTLHPWYVTWVLPFAAAYPRTAMPSKRAVLLLASLAPLLHHPGWLELTQGTWTDLPAVRALVHAPVWGLLVWDVVFRGRLAGARGLGYAPASPDSDDRAD